MSVWEHEFGCEVLEIANRIRPFLAGRPPVMQSAVLAELLGLLLAGHYIPGEPELTYELRQEVMARHCALVWELTRASAKILKTDQ